MIQNSSSLSEDFLAVKLIAFNNNTNQSITLLFAAYFRLNSHIITDDVIQEIFTYINR